MKTDCLCVASAHTCYVLISKVGSLDSELRKQHRKYENVTMYYKKPSVFLFRQRNKNNYLAYLTRFL